MVTRLLLILALIGVLLSGAVVALAQSTIGIVDLGADQEDFRVEGTRAGDNLGEMTSGDINDDGISDLIVGASGYDFPGDPHAVPVSDPVTNGGAAYVIFGSSSLAGSVALQDGGAGADVMFYGYQDGGSAGHVVASGDLNGDGDADIVISSDPFDYGGRADTGAVYVIYGPMAGGASPISLDDTSVVDVTIYGAGAADRFGRALAIGDVNGDGVDDLIVGAYQADREYAVDCGRAYVFYGGPSLPATIDLGQSGTIADVTIIGAHALDLLGRSVAAGDVNGDGIDDLIIGIYQAGPGQVAVIYGGALPSETEIDLADDNITGLGAGVLFEGVNGDDGFGFYVAAGNINGDRNSTNDVGYADILVGAYLQDHNETGGAYVLYGGPGITDGATVDSGTWTVPAFACADVTFSAAASGDRMGRSMASGDVNGDGFDDVVIGASHADPDVGRANAGETYVFYGGLSLPSTITVDPTVNTDLTVLGDVAGDEAGRATANGDLTGDGVDDLVVGAVLASSGAGEIYVISGPGATAITVTPSESEVSAGDTVEFTVTASNRFAQSWDVTDYLTTYSAPPEAGGSWEGNVFTAGNEGTWEITATHRGIIVGTTEMSVEGPTAVTVQSLEAVVQGGGMLNTFGAGAMAIGLVVALVDRRRKRC